MQNGEAKQLPPIQIGWDQETQEVHLNFDPQQFKRWEFIMSLLDMAKRECAWRLKQAQAMQIIDMQQKAVQAASVSALQAEGIRKRLHGA